MDLSIVIPAYNEAERLPQSLRRIRSYLETQPWTAEIVVVDDGSTDATAERVRSAGLEIRLIHHQHNRGKGAAVRTGMLAARGDWRLLTDADLSTPIEELGRFWDQRGQADILLGSRRITGAEVARRQAWWKVLLGQLGNFLIQGLLVPGVRDSQCGFKLFAARTQPIFTAQQLNRFGFDFELLWLARRFGFRLLELPVRWLNDSQSKVAGWDYLNTLLDIVRIRWYQLRGHYPNKL